MHDPVHIIHGRAGPSSRWREAFTNGHTLNWPPLPSAKTAGDGANCSIYWVSVRGPWQEVIRWAGQSGSTGVVVVSPEPQDVQAMEVLDAGARGYCHSLAVPSVLWDVQRAVAAGGLWVGAEVISRIMQIARVRAASDQVQVRLQKLSVREAAVANLVLRGRSNKEVARELKISERTVKAHLGAIFEKLGVRDRLQLALVLLPETSGPSEPL